MKHIFSTGEILYAKNAKKLSEGDLVAEHLHYDTVSEDSEFEVVGKLDEKPVSVKFRINRGFCDDLKFKFMVKILMQSDLLAADWEHYSICYL
jgi:hypothetical protein